MVTLWSFWALLIYNWANQSLSITIMFSNLCKTKIKIKQKQKPEKTVKKKTILRNIEKIHRY